ncbi:thyrotropin-releasing hormone receptor-like [Paramacrobiotus metropolitanus]|uniref:thyrotropin-releasing hormone receptor-like n=1 Tax=Paramacrobiotus metropolitanus TaxID=2943436 RepID=UPI0024457CD5|nr:thyrotropin-releasing hormone receptor-like [Paramacrobiotus metropolitanus]
MALAIFSYMSNSFIVLVYARSPQLRTPFNSYLLTLSLLDLIKSSTSSVNNISNYLRFRWVFGEFMCLLNLYCAQITSACIVTIHVLISLNRLWAVTFPFSYRTRHTRKLAAGLIIAVVVVLNALSLPVFLDHDCRSRTPGLAHLCIYNLGYDTLYRGLYGYLTHLIPQMLVTIIYPIVFWKVKILRKTRDDMVMQPIQKAEQYNSHSVTRAVDITVVADNSKKQPHIPEGSGWQKRNRHFTVLTILFINSLLFWTPGHVIYSFMMTASFLDVRTLAIVNYLFSLDCTMNPFLCMLASKPWRCEAVNSVGQIRHLYS